MQEELKTILKPLYKGLLESASAIDNICPFCLQWGTNFPQENKSGILFVGKATNGWITTSGDPEVLFGSSNNRIFARSDQMKWVHNLEKDLKYNTLKSSFWRVIKNTAQAIYGKDEWYSKVAWTNVFKLAPLKGNPNAQLKALQRNVCKTILKEEIRILSPRFVIFLTSGWENFFLNDLLKAGKIDSERVFQWGKYKTTCYVVDGTVYIASAHPQGKNEYYHVKTLIQILKTLLMP